MRETSSNVERAAELLLALGGWGPEGATLQELSVHLGENKSPVHRALATLLKKGFVEQSGRRGAYRLGPAIYALSRQRGSLDEPAKLAREAAVEVAAVTGLTTYLMARAGLDAVCLEMLLGTGPLQTLTGGAGGRVPLGVPCGSLSLLATLPENEREAVIRHNGGRYASLDSCEPFSAEIVGALVQRTIDAGYALDRGLFFANGGGVGVAIPNRLGSSDFAISVGMHGEQFDEPNLGRVVGQIRDAIRRISPAP